MRALMAIPLLGLTLLGGCGQRQYLLSERIDEAPTATTDSLRNEDARYTNNPTWTAKTQVIQISLTDPLTVDEKIRIVAAAEEWNHVMNGAIRFDVLPEVGATPPPGAWVINLAKTPWKISEQNNPQPLAALVRYPSGGGLITIYANRLERPEAAAQFGDHTLRGMVVSQLGLVLGAPTTRGPLYTSAVQDCIDKKVATEAAAAHNLPIAQLNWCVADVSTPQGMPPKIDAPLQIVAWPARLGG